MQLTVLGCSGSMPGPTSAASSYLVTSATTAVVFDLGAGSFGPLQQHLDPTTLDGVVLSHLHADHCADLAALEVWLRFGPGPSKGRMRVCGPEGTRERLHQLTQTSFAELDAAFEFETLTPGEAVQVGDIEVTPFPARHPVPAFCFAIAGPSHRHSGTATLSYTGDTDLCEGAIAAAQDADLLLAEAAFSNESEPRGIHLTGTRAGELATAAKVDALVLTHLQPWADAEAIVAQAGTAFGGSTDLAATGKVFTL